MTPIVLNLSDDLDAQLEALPNQPAVFLIAAESGEPYLARTGMLRRRLKRLLGPRSGTSRLLHLRGIATRVEYWLTNSRLSTLLLFYELARQHFPDRYEDLVRFRWPSYVKLLTSNEFPRTTVTTRVTAGGGPLFGPFRTRAAAEEFEQEMLDLFQVRRCPEDLVPAVDHPGCIYGEMNRCLRPCQQAVSSEEYQSEVNRLATFLNTAGESLLHTISSARDRLSEELQFEEAARQQARLVRLEQLLRLRDDLASCVDRLFGVAVLPMATPDEVELRFLAQGIWYPAEVFRLAAPAGAEMVPLDRRLRELMAEMPLPRPQARLRQEHLALLVRWVFSSWRDGEWLRFDAWDKAPYRKLVNAIARTARGGSQHTLQ